MTKSVAVRALAAASLAAPVLAAASEAAVEGQGEVGGLGSLLALVGGVAGLGVVIWLLLKFMNRKG